MQRGKAKGQGGGAQGCFRSRRWRAAVATMSCGRGREAARKSDRHIYIESRSSSPPMGARLRRCFRARGLRRRAGRDVGRRRQELEKVTGKRAPSEKKKIFMRPRRSDKVTSGSEQSGYGLR